MKMLGLLLFLLIGCDGFIRAKVPFDFTPGNVGTSDGSSGPSAFPGNAIVGSWRPISDMTSIRYTQQTVTLNNGKVLNVGGSTAMIYLDTSEIYDPVTNIATSTGSMGSARWMHGMIKLNDGRVMVLGGGDATNNATSSVIIVFGGVTGSGPTATSEIYGPNP